MKKLQGVIFVSIGILTGIFGYFLFANRASSPLMEASLKKPSVSLVLDTGETIATYSGISATTAYDALAQVSSTKDIDLGTKAYDFGVFVERISGFSSANDRAWIYFVNGTAGDVAADKKQVQNGDVVLWRYMKPETP